MSAGVPLWPNIGLVLLGMFLAGPVVLGPDVAARIACTVMALAQLLVISLMMIWDRPWHALAITALLVAQIFAMRVLLRDPKGKAPWYNGTGVLFYVSGMMIAAFALRGM